MAEYRLKYHTLRASIKEQNISIKDAHKFGMVHKPGPASKSYLTVVNDQMQKD